MSVGVSISCGQQALVRSPHVDGPLEHRYPEFVWRLVDQSVWIVDRVVEVSGQKR